MLKCVWPKVDKNKQTTRKYGSSAEYSESDIKLFRNDFEGDFNLNVTVEVDGGGVVADFLDGIKSDELAVDVVTELLESLGNLDGVDRTEDCTGR